MMTAAAAEGKAGAHDGGGQPWSTGHEHGSAAVSILGVLLALLLASAAWMAWKPGWQVVIGPPEDPPNRIPVTAFCDAARQQGWDFAADGQLLRDLVIGLRQAGLDGTIEIWGRRCRTAPALRKPDEPLARIPATFWKHHELGGLGTVAAVTRAGNIETRTELTTDNTRVHTRPMPGSEPPPDDAGYRDIHLNLMQAMDWLQTEANACKGISRRGRSGTMSGQSH